MSEQATFKLRRARLLASEPQPWRLGTPPLADINPVPSMICEDESRFLHWIARHRVSGGGQVVDLGPLAGGSTHALASGLALNRSAAHVQVHAYDLWRFMPGWEAFFPGAALRPGDNIRPFFEGYVKAHRGRIVAHQGGLARQRWSGEPIELLFIDAAKTSLLWEHIARQFLPHCVPGALVVHQDWACAECPWLHATMARLSDYFTPVDSPEGATVAFRLERSLPRSVIESKDSLAAASGHFARATSWMVGWYALEIRLAEAHWCAMHDREAEAARILGEVLAHPDCAESLKYDLELVVAAIRERRARRSRSVYERARAAFARTLRRAAIAIRVRTSRT